MEMRSQLHAQVAQIRGEAHNSLNRRLRGSHSWLPMAKRKFPFLSLSVIEPRSSGP